MCACAEGVPPPLNTPNSPLPLLGLGGGVNFNFLKFALTICSELGQSCLCQLFAALWQWARNELFCCIFSMKKERKKKRITKPSKSQTSRKVCFLRNVANS